MGFTTVEVLKRENNNNLIKQKRAEDRGAGREGGGRRGRSGKEGYPMFSCVTLEILLLKDMACLTGKNDITKFIVLMLVLIIFNLLIKISWFIISKVFLQSTKTDQYM